MLPEFQCAVCVRAFMKRDVGFGLDDSRVEGGISKPGVQDAMVKFKTIHLSTDEVIVDPLRNRPAFNIKSGQFRLIFFQRLPLRGHGERRVVSETVADGWFLKLAPLLE